MGLRPPIIYRKSRVAAVLYAVPISEVERLLEGTGLRAVRLGAYGIVNAAWFDYGASSIGAYQEFSLGVLATRNSLSISAIAPLLCGKAGDVGAFVLALPVDSELARSGGIAIYGLPKTLVEFRLNRTPNQLDATIVEENSPICSMQIPLRLGIPAWVRQLVIYSRKEGQLMGTTIATSWLAQIDLVGRPQFRVGTRTHPIGELATQLGLESAHSLAVIHGRMGHAELPQPSLLTSKEVLPGRT